jgi:hypothetical protein
MHLLYMDIYIIVKVALVANKIVNNSAAIASSSCLLYLFITTVLVFRILFSIALKKKFICFFSLPFYSVLRYNFLFTLCYHHTMYHHTTTISGLFTVSKNNMINYKRFFIFQKKNNSTNISPPAAIKNY